MSKKALISIGIILGSTIGGYIPSLWGAGVLSSWSILTSTIGGIVGIIVGYNLGY